ncbi:MAG: NAD(P)H-hydrate dehydratase [Alphaproteobacteria bacterium]|nr:NAD(P)H-hydrate dehydratase [Alphaproteobacteria bacterium]
MNPTDYALLTPAEMAAADRAAAAAGVAGTVLMEAAGRAVAEAIMRRWSPRPVSVLCGPGNNGGDGFAAARRLAAAGWRVRVGLLGSRDTLRGDAREHATRWRGEVEPLSPVLLDGAGLVIDALFGAGLSRPLDGLARTVVEALIKRRLPVVAVDVPSGLDGATGAVLGVAAPAAITVTFFRKKPGHLLLPGRLLCGDVQLADIGIPAAVLATIGPRTYENDPALWLDAYPWPVDGTHKYKRGHAVVFGGATMTGAARLAARAAQRVGAGLTTVAAPAAAFSIYAAALESILVARMTGAGDFARLMADERHNAILVGPGAGVTPATRRAALAALATRRAVVLDADALTVFAKERKTLFKALAGAQAVITPHEGEFARLFSVAGDKLARARAAAVESRAVVVLKGTDTVIAAPDGSAAINANAPPALATGGTGDVLAGLVVGLRAQGLDPFRAACAACWLHGDVAQECGVGLIPEDLVAHLPAALARLAARGALAKDRRAGLSLDHE